MKLIYTILLLSTIAGTGFTQVNNTSRTLQTGEDNQGKTEQQIFGGQLSGTEALIEQIGKANVGTINQTIYFKEGFNQGFIQQHGNLNEAAIYQFGVFNQATILHLGNNNKSNIKQDGDNNITKISLIGDNLEYHVSQSGFGNEIYDNLVGNNFNYQVIQNGNYNSFTRMDITDPPKNYKVIQTGNDMKIIIKNGPAGTLGNK
jgi:hypothetical protein